MSVDLTPLGQAGEWLAGANLVAPFLKKILMPIGEQLGGLVSDPIEDWRKEFRKRRSERFLRVAASAALQDERSGVETITVPDYIAIPLIEKATLTDDEGLQEKWASLLANAANPASFPRVAPVFTTILANLSPREARFLDIYLDACVRQMFVKIRPISSVAIVNHSRMDDDKIAAYVANTDFRWRSNEEKSATFENLISQGTLRRDQEIDPKSYAALAGKLLAEGKLSTPYKLPTNVMVHMKDFYQLTITGAEFVLACRPFDRRP